MHRLDYQWKRQLKSEQEQASATRLVNKMLLQNILPHHVGKLETYYSLLQSGLVLWLNMHVF